MSIGKENEIKLKVTPSDIARIEKRIDELSDDSYAMLDDRRFETNILYDNPKLNLRKEDTVLRLRVMQPLGKATTKVDSSKGATAELTCKGAALRDGGFSSREEVNVKLEGYEIKKFQDVLTMLGFEATFCYEKRRTSYYLVLHGTNIEIDEVPFLGHFVEIEGKDRASIDAVIKEFGLEHCEEATAAYPALLREALRSSGLTETQARFAPPPMPIEG